jgi:hypothetical protein
MRLCRILRSPDPETEGGQPTGEFVMICRAELDELRSKAAGWSSLSPDPGDLRATRSDFVEAIEAREAAHSRELAAREQKSAELERAYKAALRDRELATALVGKPLVPGAATQLIKLWRDEFDVVDEDGEIRILTRDGRGVDQAVAERLSGPEFAHFCLPPSRGGTGSKGQGRSASPGPRPAAPRNLGEAVLIRWREAASRPQASLTASGWGRHR